MAIEIKFKGISPTKNSKLEVLCLLTNEIFINIEDYNNHNSFIYLDKMTAVRLVRELKKQIGLINESEVSNG